jgi:hypothetical protein
MNRTSARGFASVLTGVSRRGARLPFEAVAGVWFVAVLAVFWSGHLYSDDATSKIDAVTIMIERAARAAGAPHDTARAAIKPRSPFSIGSALLMGPPVALYRAASAARGRPLPRYALSALITAGNLLLTAGIGVMMLIALRRAGMSRGWALAHSLTLMCATQLLVYSSTGWSEPPALAIGFAGVAMTGAIGQPALRPRRWIVFGLCAALATLIRMEYAFFFSFIALVSAWRMRDIRPVAVIALSMAAAMAGHLWYNEFRYGAWMNFGYFGQSANGRGWVDSVSDVAGRFFSPVYTRTAWRTFFSFGRLHWFWAAPPLALVFAALRRRPATPALFRDAAWAAALTLMVTPAFGSNSWCWGNRYLYTLLPFLLAPVFFLPYTTARLTGAYAALAGAGALIASMGSLVNSHVVQEKLVARYGYETAMWEATSAFWEAPFWLHLAAFPRLALNTARLAVGAFPDARWATVRTECLDIWPAGLAAAGAPPRLAFGAWLGVAVAAAAIFWFAVLPRVRKRNTLS